MKKIITISRDFGAGGGEICRKLSEKLNYEYYDKALILRTAKEAGMDVEAILKWEEKVPINFGFGQSLFDFYSRPINEKLYDVQRDIIRGIAEKGNCIILGRNANTILKEFDSTLHVFVTAPKEFRLNRMKPQLPAESDEQLIERISQIDKQRRKYCSYNSSYKFGEAESYDICFDTSRIDIDKCVDIIYDLAK